MESILTLVKKCCGGIAEDDTTFDIDIITHINTVFMALRQMGVGPEKGFRIEDKFHTWSEFIPADDLRFEAVKTYVCSKVRLIFDPPSGAAKEALKETIAECEWRLNWEAENQ